MADKGASFSMPRLSPAPIFILLGMVLGQPFFAWSNRRVAAGDVGALRGVANNVSNAIGAAFASVVAVGLLGVFLVSTFARSELPPQLETNGRPPGAPPGDRARQCPGRRMVSANVGSSVHLARGAGYDDLATVIVKVCSALGATPFTA